MTILILGAGNLLLSDEGFGVHFIRYLEQHYSFPDEVALFDAGTLGLMAIHQLEQASRVYLVDTITAQGESGSCYRYAKDVLLLNTLPIKLSPHQAGVREMLLLSQLRGRCPEEIFLLGIIPGSVAPGIELSPPLQQCLVKLAEELVRELCALGFSVSRKQPGSEPERSGP